MDNTQFKFSQIELRDLAKAWVAISIAFGIVLMIGNPIQTFLISFLTVGVGFIVHELGHKFVAQYYHLRAEFRSDDKMLILAIVMSLFGFVFAAPGAVMIMGHVPKDKYGHISIAGPAMNIVLAVLFTAIGLIVTSTGVLGLIMHYGALINSWLALFNMIPFGNFDGIKIWRWNKPTYIVTLVVALLLVVF